MHTNALIALALAAAAGHAAAYPATGPNARRAAFDAFAGAQGAPGAPAALAPTAATGSVVATPLAAATPATALPTTTAASAVGAGSGSGSDPDSGSGAGPGAGSGATAGTNMGPGSDDMASILSQVEQFIDEISGGQVPGASAPPAMTQQSKRDTAPAPADGSEALGIDTVFKVGKALFHGAEALFGGGSSSSQQQRRGLLTQAQLTQAQKSQPSNEGLVKVGNTVYKVARDTAPAPADGSEALGLDTVFKVGKAIFHGAEALFGGSSDSSNQQKREFLTLLARDAAAAAADPNGSEALGLDTIFKVGKAVFHGAEALFGGGDSSQSSKRAPFGVSPGGGFNIPAETGTLAPNNGMHPGPKMFPAAPGMGELN